MIHAVNGYILIEPILPTQQETEQLKKRLEKSGLLVAESKPDNKSKFEGVPTQGYIRFLPEAYDGNLEAGMHIVFDEKSPAGFKHEGMVLFSIKQDQIIAVVFPEVDN